MFNCDNIAPSPIIKAHPQAGRYFDNIGTFGHASFFQSEIERREESEQSGITNPVARPDFEQQIL